MAMSYSLDEFNIENARQFIIKEQERNVLPFTIQARVRALKSFSSWLLSEGYKSDNLLIHLRLPKVPNKLIELLDDNEIN